MAYLADTMQPEDSVKRYQAAYQKLATFFKKENKTVYDLATNRDFCKSICKILELHPTDIVTDKKEPYVFIRGKGRKIRTGFLSCRRP